MKSLATTFRLGESTVRQIIYEACTAIFKKLSPNVMPVPIEADWKRKEQRFRRQWNFPNCIGALDGKHVIIEAPPKTGSLYFSYKKTFTIVLLALVDADYHFTVIDVGALGKNSDSQILNNSNFGKALINGQLNLPADRLIPGTDLRLPHVIVGDEAFPLTRHLMRPYPANQLTNDEDKKAFNYRLSRARRVSENAFGLLVKKFRVYERRFSLLPKHVNVIILATCCLHNLLRNDICYWSEEEAQRNVVTEAITDLPYIGGQAALDAMCVRDQFKRYFVSPTGTVEWQSRVIRRGMRRN